MIRLPTDIEIARFQSDGVVHLRDAISLNTIQQLAFAIDKLSSFDSLSSAGLDLENLGDVAFSDAERIEYDHAKQYDLELLAGWLRYADNSRAVEYLANDAPQGAFILDSGCWRRNAAIADIATGNHIAKLAAALLDSRKIGFYDDQIFVKRPGTKQRTEWHQDYPFFHIAGNQGLVIWIPVDPVDRGNGAMRYVRGSHKWETNYGASTFISRTLMPGAPGDLVPDIDAEESKFDIVEYETSLGDVIIHHFKTLHAAYGNMSRDRQRRALSLRYVGDDMRYTLKGGAPIQPHHTCALREGMPVWCDDFPLILDRDNERVEHLA